MMKKWLVRVACVCALLLLGALGLAWNMSLGSARPVGFQLANAAGEDGQPLVIGIWYPTERRAWPRLLGPMLVTVARDAPIAGSRLAMIVLSHGNGGGLLSHADLALALASAGYVVVTPVHRGDNFGDQSGHARPGFFQARTRQLHATIEHMRRAWPHRGALDPDRVGAFGFSMGGFSVLTAAGARPDLTRIAPYCARQAEFACDVLRHGRSPLIDASAPGAQQGFAPHPAIGAVVLAAPGYGFTMGDDAFAQLRVPVQLWSGEFDQAVGNAEQIRGGLGERAEVHVEPGAGHLAFLAPCTAALPAMRALPICTDAHGFDRAAFHQRMNRAVIAFFDQHLRTPPGSGPTFADS